LHKRGGGTGQNRAGTQRDTPQRVRCKCKCTCATTCACSASSLVAVAAATLSPLAVATAVAEGGAAVAPAAPPCVAVSASVSSVMNWYHIGVMAAVAACHIACASRPAIMIMATTQFDLVQTYEPRSTEEKTEEGSGVSPIALLHSCLLCPRLLFCSVLSASAARCARACSCIRRSTYHPNANTAPNNPSSPPSPPAPSAPAAAPAAAAATASSGSTADSAAAIAEAKSRRRSGKSNTSKRIEAPIPQRNAPSVAPPAR
jgi:hypothetical protein